MSPRGSVRAEHVWKRFRGERVKARRRAADQLKILGNMLLRRDPHGWRWPLRDVSVVAEPGESIGLVGVNGSGKTTLLKILAGVLFPYAGRVRVSGRIGSIIEVKAGIHPELTGRENVYLFGSILGLPRRETARRFDRIVEFAQLESAIDRQVKFYSSGMEMRLGFAVAAFLEPDVLLVDEVLAVGDASFQQRCFDRMREVLVQGTTLIYVSHDLPTIEATCSRGIWLHDGVIQVDGAVREAVGAYRRLVEEAAEASPRMGGPLSLKKAEVSGEGSPVVRSQGPLNVRLALESIVSREAAVYVGVSEGTPAPIFFVHREVLLRDGETEVECAIPKVPLPGGRFYLWVGVYGRAGREELLGWHPAAQLDVAGPELEPGPMGVVRLSPVQVEASWDVR